MALLIRLILIEMNHIMINTLKVNTIITNLGINTTIDMIIIAVISKSLKGLEFLYLININILLKIWSKFSLCFEIRDNCEVN